MKTVKILTTLFLVSFLYSATYASCDSCKVNAHFNIVQDSIYNYTFADSSFSSDSCTVFLYSILSFNNGQSDTIFTAGNPFDNKSGDTANIICQLTVARYYDSLLQRWDTCTASYCDTIEYSICGDCNVTAGFSSQELWNCNWRLIDTSSIDTTENCLEHLYSVMDYGNELTATINPGDTFPDLLSLGTKKVCLTTYARTYNDTLQTWDTCSNKVCRNITKQQCENPWRLAKPKTKNQFDQIKVYPTSTNNLINVELTEGINMVRILNIQGREVKRYQISSNLLRIDI